MLPGPLPPRRNPIARLGTKSGLPLAIRTLPRLPGPSWAPFLTRGKVSRASKTLLVVRIYWGRPQSYGYEAAFAPKNPTSINQVEL